MSFALTTEEIDSILGSREPLKKEECPQCDKGCLVRDTNKKNGAWIDEGQFVIQEWNEKGWFFMRKFDIKYCPYCGRELNNRRKAK